MHYNIVVLISVILVVVVQVTHSYRVVAKNGRFYHQPINPYDSEEQDDALPFIGHSKPSRPPQVDYINSLSDLLYLTAAANAADDSLAAGADDDSVYNNELIDLLPTKMTQRDDDDDDDDNDVNGWPSVVSSSPSSDSSNDLSAAQAAPVDEEELESHSSLIGGQVHQYVSGGAGEGVQHLKPDGAVDNKEEVKSDEDLPAYCDPPNPCPRGVIADDCDPRPFEHFTAEFSKMYQEQQNCMCDDDHNECHKRSKQFGSAAQNGDRVAKLIANLNEVTQVVAKKSPRVRREAKSTQNDTKKRLNPYLRGRAIKLHVAKKSHSI